MNSTSHSNTYVTSFKMCIKGGKKREDLQFTIPQIAIWRELNVYFEWLCQASLYYCTSGQNWAKKQISFNPANVGIQLSLNNMADVEPILGQHQIAT